MLLPHLPGKWPFQPIATRRGPLWEGPRNCFLSAVTPPSQRPGPPRGPVVGSAGRGHTQAHVRVRDICLLPSKTLRGDREPDKAGSSSSSQQHDTVHGGKDQLLTEEARRSAQGPGAWSLYRHWQATGSGAPVWGLAAPSPQISSLQIPGLILVSLSPAWPSFPPILRFCHLNLLLRS